MDRATGTIVFGSTRRLAGKAREPVYITGQRVKDLGKCITPPRPLFQLES